MFDIYFYFRSFGTPLLLLVASAKTWSKNAVGAIFFAFLQLYSSEFCDIYICVDIIWSNFATNTLCFPHGCYSSEFCDNRLQRSHH